MNEMLLDYGPWVAIALWLTQQIWRQYQSWQDRRWNKADQSEDKVTQLYERFIEQQRDMLTIIDRNTDALVLIKDTVEQVRMALERELSDNTGSIRGLIERVSIMEKRIK